jgi:transcriptional/translational regulatory protein YebC/TACO1
LKAKNDAQKSAVFTRLAKMIQMEAKKANGNLSSSGLKTAIEKARAVDMPSDNIERAIKKATTAEQMDAVTYEAYGPGATALIIEALTSNKNKAAAEIKHILSKNGTSLAASGSASWAFEKTNEGWVPKVMAPISKDDADALQKLIDDLEENEEVQEVFTNAEFMVDSEAHE